MTRVSSAVPSPPDIDIDGGGGRTSTPQIIDSVQQGDIIQCNINDNDDDGGSGGMHTGRQESSLPQQHHVEDERNKKLNCHDDSDNFIGDVHHLEEENNILNNDHYQDSSEVNCGTKQINGGLASANIMSNVQTQTITSTVLESSQTSRTDNPTEFVEAEHHRMTRRRRRRVPAAVIEQDASTAFSQYRPVPPLALLTENCVSRNAGETKGKIWTGKQGNRRRGRRDKKDKKRDRNNGSQCTDDIPSHASEDNIQTVGNASATPHAKSHHPLHRNDDANTNTMHPNTTSKIIDPIHSILPDDDDPILQDYLPQLMFLSDNYYSRVKPFRMGRRNLPLNQLELILRRRAVIKRSDAQKEQTSRSVVGLDREDAVGKEGGSSKINSLPAISTTSRKPPPHPHSPPRRKLFPLTTQQHSPNRTHLKADYHDDDSTISSTTIASQLTKPGPMQQSSEPISTPQQHSISSKSCDTAIATSAIPTEEIIGDTSLGLKLTIIQGKVILQKITPLDDGRASPAQLCGLLSPGDIIIAVNGKSLINGTIHNPVSMDKIITVLKPLSQPMDAVSKEYSREVRLRFVLAEGKAILREQEEREKQKAYERDMRKKLGLNSGGGGRGGVDPAADLFGIGAFMGVDQHSGMPMFGNLERHHEEEKKNESNLESVDILDNCTNDVVAADSVPVEANDAANDAITCHHRPILFAPARPTVQAQIAHQIYLDRLWIRHRNTSEFFTLNNNAPLLLRPPSPQPDQIMDCDAVNSIDARKRRLERGSQVMTNATSLVSVVESQENEIESFVDEDPMEVASRVCGTATVRTGASRRRWHRGDSVIIEEASSHAASNDEGGTIRSGESGVEACDHRLLVELAANNESWKMNLLRRLDDFAVVTEKENIESLHGNNGDSNTVREEAGVGTFDSFLFGGDVAKILGKQKQSMALPPGEMTAMLFDLVELLESGLPNQIFTKDELSRTADPPFLPDRVVSFARNDANTDVAKATDFLLNRALDKWLKSFRPLPWKQRRALWPTHQSGLDGETMISSRMDDNDSLSMTSGTTAQTRSPERHKRNLRELIEQLELDPETRRETCILVTFFLTRKLRASALPSSNYQNQQSRLPKSAEDEALTLIEAYGSYIDIHTCLVVAGQLHSKSIVDKLLCLAKYDSQHKEAVKALERARTILLYETNMLSALLDLLPSIVKLPSNNLDFITLLVSAYPDLQPWTVREASNSEHCGGFYSTYLLSLMHHEEGNDAAKQDEALVKEFCLMLCSFNDDDPSIEESHRRGFFHIASRDDPSSEYYNRDLPFLMDCSARISEFGLTLSLANEIISSRRYSRDQKVYLDVLQHIGIISDQAIEGNDGEVNTILLGQVISFLSVFSSRMAEKQYEFDLGAELSKFIEKCNTKHENNLQQPSCRKVDACITTISENAPPAYSLQVLAQWEHACQDSSTFIAAIQTSLISGARDGVRSELSGSMLRIQRAREEGRRPETENEMVSWSGGSVESEVKEGDGEFIWSKVVDGLVAISK